MTRQDRELLELAAVVAGQIYEHHLGGRHRWDIKVMRVDPLHVHSQIMHGKGGRISTPHADFQRYLTEGKLRLKQSAAIGEGHD